MKIIGFKKKKTTILTKKQQELYKNVNICYICQKNLKIDIWKIKKYLKVRDHCHYTGEYRGTVHSICNLKYSLPKEFPIVFHNGSNYNYHFFMKVLAEKLKQFTCLGENTE